MIFGRVQSALVIAVAVSVAFAFTACDEPPNGWTLIQPDLAWDDGGMGSDGDVDGDSDGDVDGDSDGDGDGDSDVDTEPMSCSEALWCVIDGGGGIMECIAGTDQDAQSLMIDLGMCLFGAGCLGGDDMMACAMENCPEEALACLADS